MPRWLALRTAATATPVSATLATQLLDGTPGDRRPEAAVTVDDEDRVRGPGARRPGRRPHGAAAQPLGEHVEAAEAVGGVASQVPLQQELRLLARRRLRHPEAGQDVRGQGAVLLGGHPEQAGHGRSIAA